MMLHRIASNDTGYDARAVANALLDRAEASGMAVTNLALQKLVYFAHGLMLTRHGRSLVDGYFEAWEHGPVHPVLYGAFKHSGREPIAERARRRDFRSGGLGAVVSAPLDRQAEATLDDVLGALGHQPPWRLRAISHASDGPWDHVVNKKGTEGTRLGLRISDIVVAERFHRHLLVVGSSKDTGDADTESAPT